MLNRTTNKILIPPPITADKKFPITSTKIFATRCPKMLQGNIIREYLKVVDIMFSFKFGMVLFILLIFNKLITDIEIRYDTVIALTFMIGVNISNEIIKMIDPRR